VIEQSEEFRAAASAGRLTFLDLGAGNATIETYGTARPAANADPGGTPLLITTLAKPAGEVVGGSIILAADEPAGDLVLQSGIAVWARFKNGDGDWVFDCDVSADGGGGEVQFIDIQLYAGGRAPLSPSSIG
jgi:hypothetical protein